MEQDNLAAVIGIYTTYEKKWRLKKLAEEKRRSVSNLINIMIDYYFENEVNK